jgi:hypothetical protein
VIHLEIGCRGIELKGKGIKDTWEYLKESLALTTLEKCAQDKIPTMPFFDEIEVYLAFVLKGWQRLNLPPLDIREMLFHSYVRESEFDAAAEKVRDQWKNTEKVCDYLLESPDWIAALHLEYPTEMTAVEQAKNRVQEIEPEVTRKYNKDEDEDPLCKEYEQLAEIVREARKKLTMDALKKLIE